MAIWQFKVFLIPQGAIRERFGHMPVTISTDAAQDFRWWAKRQPQGIEREISELLSETSRWGKDLRIWGDERSDSIVVCYEDDDRKTIIEIEFCIDVRHLSSKFVTSTCELAKRFGCVLVHWQSGRVLMPDVDALLDAINRSRAKKFVEDPAGTLKNLPDGTAEAVSLTARRAETRRIDE